jgi:Protein of unknown function (DUF2865)
VPIPKQPKTVQCVGVKVKGIRNLAIAIALPAAVALIAGEALAQSPICGQLQSDYRALLRQGDSGGRGQQLVDIDRLRQEIAEAQIAAKNGNCQAIGFLFLKPRKSPQCPAIMARMGQLQQQLAQVRGGVFAFNRSPEFERARLRDTLLRNGCNIPQYFAGGYRTLCVRLCDGYYFPISFSTGQNRFPTDAEVCQSMYAQPDQAELFVQRSNGDVDDAASLDGERYGQQLYAFNYRSRYEPACASELTRGIAALGQRYLAARQERRGAPSVTAVLLPMPVARPTPSEDPETTANEEGSFRIRPLRSSSDYVAAADNPGIRIIGAAYYADLFDLTKPPPEPAGPRFDLIGSAQADERNPEPTLGAAEPPDTPATTVQ